MSEPRFVMKKIRKNGIKKVGKIKKALEQDPT